MYCLITAFTGSSFRSFPLFQGHVITKGETLNIVDAYEDERFNPDVDRKTGYRTRTVLCAPIYGKEKAIIGVVQLVNKKKGHFTAKDESAFETFATYCGLALHNANLYDQLWKSEQVSFVKCQIHSLMSSDLDCMRVIAMTWPIGAHTALLVFALWSAAFKFDKIGWISYYQKSCSMVRKWEDIFCFRWNFTIASKR